MEEISYKFMMWVGSMRHLRSAEFCFFFFKTFFQVLKQHVGCYCRMMPLQHTHIERLKFNLKCKTCVDVGEQ